MNPDDWIIVPNWGRFQHYKERRPPWIKLYTEVVTRSDMLDLTDAEFGLLARIWALTAAEQGQIRARTLPEHGRNRGRTRALERLSHAGFIQFSASKPQAPLTVETETELNPPKPPQTRASTTAAENELAHRAKHFASNWAGGTSEAFDDQLDNLEEECHGRLTYSQRAQLWDIALGRVR